MRKLALLLAGLAPSCGHGSPPAPAVATAVVRAETPAVEVSDGRTPEERRALLRRGLDAADAGRVTEAEAALQRVVERSAELGDHALAPLARLAAKRGDRALARQRWSMLATRWPDSIWIGEASLALAEDRFVDGDIRGATGWLARARNDDLRAEIRAKALGLARRIARQSGDVRAARAIGEELRTGYRGTPEAREAAEEAWQERATTVLTDIESAIEEVDRRLKDGEGLRALELAHDALRRFPRGSSYPELELRRATALARTGAGEEAVAALESIRRTYPGTRAAASALYRLGSGAWNTDDDARALGLFAEYRRLFPSGENAAQALYATGRIAQEDRRWDAAATSYAEVARRYPQSDLAAESAWRVGWCRYRGGDFEGAIRAFDDATRRNLEVPASLYWKARSLESTGRSAHAIYEQILRDHPESYYAMRTEERLGQPIGSALRVSAAPVGNSSALVAPEPNVHWTRFDELRKAELLTLARLELQAYDHAVSLGESRSRLLIPAWQAVDGWSAAVRIAIRANGCKPDNALVRTCYPLGYEPALRKEATQRGLDVFLVAALIRQESLYDTRARSPADARGLMQLLPSTAGRVARSIGRPAPEPEDLYSPEINLPLGTTYLAGLLERYEGKVVLALAGYNAGERAAEKWRDRYPGLGEDEFVESISYGETRSYVKRVMQNRRLYRALYR